VRYTEELIPSAAVFGKGESSTSLVSQVDLDTFSGQWRQASTTRNRLTVFVMPSMASSI